jgi:hypothetical protein
MAANSISASSILQELAIPWPTIIGFVAVLFVVSLLGGLLKRAGRKTVKISYSRRERLLTASESKFFHELQNFLDGKFELFAQVRVADVLKPNSRDYASLNRITSKHVDFVITSKDLRILVCIELDDRTHSRPDRVERDRFLNKAFESAGLPLVRFGEDWKPLDFRPRLHQLLELG